MNCIQTDTNYDLCTYEQSIDQFKYITDKIQYKNSYCVGSVGLMCSNNSVRDDLIDIDSALQGYNNIASYCNSYKDLLYDEEDDEDQPAQWEIEAAYNRDTVTVPDNIANVSKFNMQNNICGKTSGYQHPSLPQSSYSYSTDFKNRNREINDNKSNINNSKVNSKVKEYFENFESVKSLNNKHKTPCTDENFFKNIYN